MCSWKLRKSTQVSRETLGDLGILLHEWDANHYLVAEKYTQPIFE